MRVHGADEAVRHGIATHERLANPAIQIIGTVIPSYLEVLRAIEYSGRDARCIDIPHAIDEYRQFGGWGEPAHHVEPLAGGIVRPAIVYGYRADPIGADREGQLIIR